MYFLIVSKEHISKQVSLSIHKHKLPEELLGQRSMHVYNLVICSQITLQNGCTKSPP